MNMTFEKLNNRLGWAVFIIATLVYMMTLERTVSLWDCGEYIATSNKLEVGHPPGAPLFMMLGRLFSAFAGPETVAFMINVMSGLSSSFTILFMFWTISLLGRKLAHYQNNKSSAHTSRNDEELSSGQRWAILGSALVGSLAYTFTDSFWFSAVEAEVYAMSSFFTALVFWAIFKWERIAHQPNADRWLVFIAFMIGLSIGVHLLNLLAIPAVGFIYYFRRFKTTTPVGFIVTGVVSLITLVIIQEGIIPKTISYAASFEIFSTNTLGLPFNLGTFLFGILLATLIAGAVIYARKKGKVNLHTAMVSLMMLYAGYTCFAMITIRSNANPPIDENNPENLVSLNSYLLREQYGDWPLFYGPYWNSITENPSEYEDRSDVFIKAYTVVLDGSDVKGFRNEEDAKAYADKFPGAEVEEKYYMSNERSKSKPTYTSETSTFLPRMYSSDSKHVREYIRWSGYTTEGKEPIINPYAQPGTPEAEIYLPSFSENIRYLFRYQIGHMYLRYFMWNFAGRQNDEQNWDGNLMEGNWLSGIDFIDNERLGSQANLADHMKENKAYNKLYMLPLILGLIGFIFHMVRAPKDWFVVMLTFLFTGLAIVFYLNQKPIEPRERDYAYAGSTYAFTIWIGLSVYALWDIVRSLSMKQLGTLAAFGLGIGIVAFLGEFMNDGHHALSYSLFYMTLVAAVLTGIVYALKQGLKDDGKVAMGTMVLCLLVPVLMAAQEWDDHDRSGRATARELAKNYLKPCAQGAVLFTNGDNDTFPLWYVQEVEGFRTDIRVVNLSLLNTDWYVDQAARKAYDSDALPISFTEEEDREGNGRDFIAMPNLVAGVYYRDAQSGKADKYIEKAFAKVSQFQNKEINIKDALKFIQSEKGENNYIFIQGDKSSPSSRTYYFPTNKFYFPIDKKKVLATGTVSEKDAARIVDTMHWQYNESGLYRNSLIILDMMATGNWDRPIYFAATGGNDAYAGLENYLQLEGMVYRLVPIAGGTKTRYISPGYINTEKSYQVLMNEFDWGGLNKPGVNIDYYTRRPTVNFRRYYLALADALLTEKDPIRAKEVMDKCMSEFPPEFIPYDFNTPYMVDCYLQIADALKQKGKTEDAVACEEAAKKIVDEYTLMQNQTLVYLLDKEFRYATDPGISNNLSMTYTMISTLSDITSGRGGELETTTFETKISMRDKILLRWDDYVKQIVDESDEEDKLSMRDDFLNANVIETVESFLFDLSDVYITVRNKHLTLEPAAFEKMIQSSTEPSTILLRDEIANLKSHPCMPLLINYILVKNFPQAKKGDQRASLLVHLINDFWPEIN
jgi:tetratricopeptide (TPR) repeat protein